MGAELRGGYPGYASVRGMVPIMRNGTVYFEMSMRVASLSVPPDNLCTGSLSIGLSTKQMPLQTLVGAWNGSIGLCSNGSLLVSKRWFKPFERDFTTTKSSFNDYHSKTSTLRCLIYIDEKSIFETWNDMMVAALVIFNINGIVWLPSGERDYVDSPVMPLYVSKDENLYPTLTLHGPGTIVTCRFSASDLEATSRKEIGAPVGVTVYTVDGSILFEADY